MKQTPFTTDKGEFLAIELPEETKAVKLYKSNVLRYGYTLIVDLPGADYIDLPESDWQIITPNASEVTEEQAREIVGLNELGEFRDYNYNYGLKLGFQFAKNSLKSLLQHLGLTGTVTVLKKVK